MAEVKINGIDRLKGNIKKLFDEVRSDEQMLLDIAEETIRLTKSFNRAGKSPKGDKHPKNSLAWEERKLLLTKTNNPSEYYQPYVSNVTFTGQLLESIKLLKINRSNGSVEIDATGDRKPYKNLDGTTSKAKKIPTNKKLSEYLADIGRDIFGINKQMENVINRIVRKYLNLEIKKRFNK